MTKDEIQSAIDDMVRRIVKQFNPARIILFGSHARGTAGPDSDVDLLVVMPVKGSRRKLATEIDLLLTDRQLPLDVIVVTPEEYEQDRRQIGSIIWPAAREGRVLYERAGTVPRPVGSDHAYRGGRIGGASEKAARRCTCNPAGRSP